MVTSHSESHWQPAKIFFSRLLCVHHGLAGPLCQPYSELTLTEQLLSALVLATMAEEIKRAGWSVPPEPSQTTAIHIFLGKPNTMVTPKFSWVRVYNSTRWSEEQEDQILVNKPNSVTFISQPKQQCLHPCLWQYEGVLIRNLGVCAVWGYTWSLKWKDG